MTRLVLSEQMWVKLSPLLPAETGRRSRPAKSNRMMIEGVLWRLRCGAPWRDMPEAFGPWSSVYNRFNRWSQAGIWQRVFSLIQGDVDNEWNFIDSTIVKAHQHASGGKKGIDQGIGASRGGQTTKIHMVPDSHGNPIYFEISGGQVHDARMAAAVITQSSGEWIMADKGYDSAEIRGQIEGQGSIPIIPQRRGNSQQNPHFDSELYKARHLVENLFAKLKHFRGFATRFDKLARNFLSSISLAGIIVWARL